MEAMPFKEAAIQGHDPLAAALARCRNLEGEVRQLSAIVDSSDEAIVATRPDGSIGFWSKGAERLFGYAPPEAEGRTLSFLVGASQRDELAGLADRARRGLAVREHDIRGRRKNGVEIDLSLSMSVMENDSGHFAGTCVVARDVTQQRWMADTLNSTLQSLEAALNETRESEERCRRFTADAAHQIRTPIAGIRACAETLLRRPSPEEQEALLSDVVRETARAGRLMTALLQMARLDQGQTLRPSPCDVAALCATELERIRPIAPQLELDVQVFELPQSQPELDRHAVGEMLSNLFDNASRHAGSHIGVTIGTVDDLVEIRVVDDGPGVPPERVERIFDRFVTLDGTGGSGLGLPIAKALAQAHGGDLTYEGATFVLRLPIKATIDCGGAGRPDFADSGAPGGVDWENWAAP